MSRYRGPAERGRGAVCEAEESEYPRRWDKGGRTSEDKTETREERKPLFLRADDDGLRTGETRGEGEEEAQRYGRGEALAEIVVQERRSTGGVQEDEYSR